VLLLASWWFLQQDIPGLQRKLFTTLLFPVGTHLASRLGCCSCAVGRVPVLRTWPHLSSPAALPTPPQLSYLYITKGLLDRTQCSSLMPICCACWFLVGFITGGKGGCCQCGPRHAG
jgi:hypothetical protein